MNATVGIWLLLRVSRWLAWIALVVICLYVRSNRDSVVTAFGQLPLKVELTIFALGFAAVFLGFMELVMREKAGLPRPSLGQLVPKRV